nr:hypothetical protein [Natrinema pallidum]
MAADIAHDAVVLTVDERNRLYERGTVLIEDGRITEVRQSRGDDADIEAARIIDGKGMLAMRGTRQRVHATRNDSAHRCIQ